LGGSKSIWPVKTSLSDEVLVRLSADCLHMVQLMPLPSQNPIISDLNKCRLLLPFWYQLTQAVLEERPLNGCSNSSTVTKIGFNSTQASLALHSTHPSNNSHNDIAINTITAHVK